MYSGVQPDLVRNVSSHFGRHLQEILGERHPVTPGELPVSGGKILAGLNQLAFTGNFALGQEFMDHGDGGGLLLQGAHGGVDAHTVQDLEGPETFIDPPGQVGCDLLALSFEIDAAQYGVFRRVCREARRFVQRFRTLHAEKGVHGGFGQILVVQTFGDLDKRRA